MASTSEKQAAVNKAASKGVGSLTANEKHAFDQAQKDMTDLGRQAQNIANGKKPGDSNRNFLGF